MHCPVIALLLFQIFCFKMTAHSNIEEGILVMKEELLSDLSKVYHEGFYHDITIVFPDNVRVSTNRLMLVCRIPYFATLLASDFTDNSSDLQLAVCSSGIFKKILDFVWEGKLQLSDMKLSTIQYSLCSKLLAFFASTFLSRVSGSTLHINLTRRKWTLFPL